jgi:hypothetical protein
MGLPFLFGLLVIGHWSLVLRHLSLVICPWGMGEMGGMGWE